MGFGKVYAYCKSAYTSSILVLASNTHFQVYSLTFSHLVFKSRYNSRYNRLIFSVPLSYTARSSVVS